MNTDVLVQWWNLLNFHKIVIDHSFVMLQLGRQKTDKWTLLQQKNFIQNQYSFSFFLLFTFKFSNWFLLMVHQNELYCLGVFCVLSGDDGCF